MRLNSLMLRSLAGKEAVAVPKFDRSQIRPGILHVGVGNFHRAHMAGYIDDLMSTNFDLGKHWGIIGAGTMHFDQTKRDLLESQDWLQTLVERDTDYTKARILGCMTEFLPVNIPAMERRLEDPDIKIVSLTITEGGYFLRDGKFDDSNEQIKHDIANPDAPQTVFGVICKAARHRRDNGLPMFTVLSCDNIPHNGDIVRKVVMGLVEAQDKALLNDGFAMWMKENAAFPNSMVDRITPATNDDQKKFIQDEFGYDDAAPVFCEPFRQWVMEDTFAAAGRPPLDILENVKFVPDVTPYEFMKLRILNGGHASLCYPSALLDLTYVHEAMTNPTISSFLNCLERQEIIPTVMPVPDVDPSDYWQTIAKRFTNPTLSDAIVRICYDGLSRQPQFIVPAVRDNLKVGRPVHGMALVSAMWCRYCQGTTDSGKAIEGNDPQWGRLHDLALQAQKNPKLWLEALSEVYGESSYDPTFVSAFEQALDKVQTIGVDAAMQQYIDEMTHDETTKA